MLKRLSSSLKRDKNNDQNANGTSNGTSNGISNGVGTQSSISSGPNAKQRTNGNTAVVNGHDPTPRRKSTFGFGKHGSSSEHEPTEEDHKGIGEMMQEFSALLHASKRPLPTQTGDGTYNGTCPTRD
jgi:hypothetical protein